MKRPVVWATIFTICGIYMRLGRSELICLVSFCVILIFVSRFVIKGKNWKYCFLLLFMIFGFFMAGHSFERETAEICLVGAIEGSGVVTEEGLTSAGNQKLTVQCDLEDSDGTILRDMKLYAIWSGEEQFEAGDMVSFSGELMPFYQASVPGGYDEELYLKTKGYDGKMYPDTMHKTGETVSFVFVNARAKVHDTLDSILPVNESGIMKAMLTGDKEDIPDESYRLYTEAGIVHVLCISGLHMSILALYVSVFTEKICKQTKRVSAVVTMLTALSFLAFTGFTPSAVRAVTMICVAMMARVVFRSHDRLNEIAIAALLILCMEPLYLFHIGFQLSFITVLWLCIAAEQAERVRWKERTWKDTLKENLRFSLYASLFSYPLVAYHFHYVSLAGIIANLVVIPLSGLLLGFGILSAVLGMIWMPAGIFVAGSVFFLLKIIQITCTLLLQVPFSYILTGCPSALVILLCYGLLFFWLKYADRKGSWKGALIFCVALWCAVFENQMFQKETTIAFLDVGQGDAAVISTYDRKTYLVDGGGVYGKEFGQNVGKTVLLPYLEYLGADAVDAAFLSHPDSDHMTGLLEIMDFVPVHELYLAKYPYKVTNYLNFLKESVEKYPIKLYTVENRIRLLHDTWTCLYPISGITFLDGDDNHGSMVLKYTYAGTSILFTGDISAIDETLLLENGADVSADILKVSHHGSGYSTKEAFLKSVAAEAAIISCGKNNIYGHPHAETLERLETADTEIYRTDTSGTILVTLKQDGSFEIETMAERKPLYERIKETMEEW